MTAPLSLAAWLAEWRELPADERRTTARVLSSDARGRRAVCAHEFGPPYTRLQALLDALARDEVQP